jgi:DMSO/TMAO reductase YedYZ molybdopterin-dependent catalytic subunit
MQPSEPVVSFADYGAEFEIEAQAANPRVKCFDLRRLTTSATPASEFFTFHQTTAARAVDLRSWRLSIGGSVSRPVSLTYDEVVRRTPVTVAATIECSGNSGNARLMNGLVSTGVWRGPALAPLLRECGLLDEAREVVFFAMDGERERKWPAGDREFEVPHGRSVFVQDGLGSDAILATEFNGKPLDAERGFPVRLILPGWYGMTQVKWLERIIVLDRRYEGRHMARNYHSLHTNADPLMETSISRMRLKSVIARVTRRGAEHLIHGAAWSGSDRLSKIEVRVGNGPWRKAEVTHDGGAYAWSLWTARWPEASAGRHVLVSRAIDARGRTQPTPDEWRRSFASSREDNSQWPRLVDISRS